MAFSWAMVQTVHYPQQVRIGHRSEILVLVDVLPDQAMRIFVRTSFPSSIRMGKIEIGLQIVHLVCREIMTHHTK